MQLRRTRLTLVTSTLALLTPLVVAASAPAAGGAQATIPIGPGSDFTVLSKATTGDPLEVDTSGPVEIEFSELRIAPGGTTGRLPQDGTLIVSVDDGVATLAQAGAGATACADRTVEGGSAVIHSGGSLSEIRNSGKSPLSLHLTTLIPAGALSPAATAGPCPATTAAGTTAKVLNRSTISVPISAQATGSSDVYVGIVRAEPGRSAGPWHVHPGPVFVAVDQSEATVKLAHGGHCEVINAPAGTGVLEMPGMVHEASNQSDQPLSFYVLGFTPSPQPLLTPRPTPSECQDA